MFHFNQLNRSEVERFEAPLNKNIVEVCLDDLSVNPTGDPTWTPVHCVMPTRYCEFAERIRNLTVYDDDVWVVTFPKAGTTWTQEMVWLITNGLDYETASKVNVTERSLFLELFAAINAIELPDTISLVEAMPRPRNIKSHLPLALLPKQLWTVKPKIVYTARNPKDVTTSYMHHYRHLHGFQGSQQDYLDGILADKLIWCPQIKHATEFWRIMENHGDHVLFLHFEDMKRNLAEVIRKVCDFFGRSLSDQEIKQLEQHLSFDTMKDNKSVNYDHLVSNVAKAMGREQTDFKYCEFAERIRNFTVFEDDVWIVTFPKAGTTWTQEMVWLIAHDLDYETATRVNLTERSVFLELNTFFTDLEVPDTISLVEQMPRPRHIKSHLPLALLPKQLWTVKPKIVYTARNPKDVTTSYMHHYRHLHGFQGSQQDFLDAILADRLNWCPQVKHATEFWRLAENHRDHVLFVHFEDMKRNMSEVLEKVGGFFGKSLSSGQVERLEKHLSFEVMKDNKFANNQNLVSYLNEAMGRKIPDFRFMRKGQIGSYKDELPEEYVNKLKLAEMSCRTTTCCQRQVTISVPLTALDTRHKMFSYRVIDSQLTTDLHHQQIEIRLNDTSAIPDGQQKRTPAHCVITPTYLDAAERIRNLTVYEDDVWIVTFPKAGTTWTQEMVWLIDHDLDYGTASKVNLLERSVFLELSWVILGCPGDTIQQVEHLPRPRHIKTHLPLAFLPSQLWTVKPRIVYCARNPKDVAVSYMHHYHHLHGFTGPKEVFLDGLLADKVLWCPQVKHALDFWNVRQLDHVLFLHFEEMKKDLTSVLLRVMEFFNKQYNEAQLEQLADHLSFDTMRKNPSANNMALCKGIESISGRKVEFECVYKLVDDSKD
ncbi:hypothetical protein pipiens_004509 [Culex pipiens pipiens]|uniref:Sulfotransferase domain-containing protein n=2 Tax=Culex pipiens TaxID=7175 RepID=A0ABD1CI84_CULPP